MKYLHHGSYHVNIMTPNAHMSVLQSTGLSSTSSGAVGKQNED